MLARKQLRFYQRLDDLQAAIRQMLVLDIRSVHQGRGRATDALFACRLDAVAIQFRTLDHEIRVVQCAKWRAAAPPTPTPTDV